MLAESQSVFVGTVGVVVMAAQGVATTVVVGAALSLAELGCLSR